MKIWVFIWRMQPIHIWHQKIIEKSMIENDFTFIILGSSELVDANNPFTNKERVSFIKSIFIEKWSYMTLLLRDNKSDKKWIMDLDSIIYNSLKKIIKNWEIKKLTFYWGDLKNDYAIRVVKDYEKLLRVKNIIYKEIDRKEFKFSHNWTEFYISSTKVREELKKSNFVILKKMLTKSVIDYLRKENKYN